MQGERKQCSSDDYSFGGAALPWAVPTRNNADATNNA